jgi:hypothetical protein
VSLTISLVFVFLFALNRVPLCDGNACLLQLCNRARSVVAVTRDEKCELEDSCLLYSWQTCEAAITASGWNHEVMKDTRDKCTCVSHDVLRAAMSRFFAPPQIYPAGLRKSLTVR